MIVVRIFVRAYHEESTEAMQTLRYTPTDQDFVYAGLEWHQQRSLFITSKIVEYAVDHVVIIPSSLLHTSMPPGVRSIHVFKSYGIQLMGQRTNSVDQTINPLFFPT